ncbi:Insect odorant-binding protein A10/Ejaculatory bulb-specific protein 3 [Trinorchestia longiramus]|nr:Insect odorant-binding protein A10/Ejaculatory bulb-specific protein 3 [Trinorchestia longiramus]
MYDYSSDHQPNMKIFACLILVTLGSSTLAQTPPPGSFDRLPENQSIGSLTPAQLQRFFNNVESVNTLTSCFADLASCPNPTAANLANQILKLGPGGSCAPCPADQQERMNSLVKIFLENYRTKYPELFEQVKPYIAHVIQN